MAAGSRELVHFKDDPPNQVVLKGQISDTLCIRVTVGLALLVEVCPCGWALRSPKFKPGSFSFSLSLPAAFISRCRTLSYFRSMSACWPPRSPP